MLKVKKKRKKLKIKRKKNLTLDEQIELIRQQKNPSLNTGIVPHNLKISVKRLSHRLGVPMSDIVTRGVRDYVRGLSKDDDLD